MITVNHRDELEWYEGMTVQDVLDHMDYSFHMITVTVNDHLVPGEEYGSYQVPDGASVTVFHLAHGG